MSICCSTRADMIYGSPISLDDNPLIHPIRQDEIIELTLSRKGTRNLHGKIRVLFHKNYYR